MIRIDTKYITHHDELPCKTISGNDLCENVFCSKLLSVLIGSGVVEDV